MHAPVQGLVSGGCFEFFLKVKVAEARFSPLIALHIVSGNCQAKLIARVQAAHRKTSRSRTQTVDRLVAATVALRAQLYMRDTSPKQSPRFFMFTRMFTPCLRSSTCSQTCSASPADTHLTLPLEALGAEQKLCRA